MFTLHTSSFPVDCFQWLLVVFSSFPFRASSILRSSSLAILAAVNNAFDDFSAEHARGVASSLRLYVVEEEELAQLKMTRYFRLLDYFLIIMAIIYL
jgi:hypothetical protein